MLKGAAGAAGAGRAASALGRLLARRPPTTIHWGLDRIRFLLAELGSPEKAFRAIHVAGTNGKGSVAATAESILRAAGRRTGLYTSPHLVAFSERIAIDGRPAGAALLESVAAELLPLAEQADATFFESVTALGFAAFARSGVDAAVVEVGLGGRLDATNVLAAPVAVITSIALDHADYLGSDLAGIAREKAGIIAPDATLVLGDVVGPAREAILEAAAAAGVEGARLLRYGEEIGATEITLWTNAEEGRYETRFVYSSEVRPGGLPLRTPLYGIQQAINAALAIAAVEVFETVPPRDEVIREGVGTVRWPGRFDVRRHDDGLWAYDIAHNPAAAELLAATTSGADLPRPIVLLAAVLGDKDWPAVLGPLLTVTDAAVFTEAPSAPAERRWDPAAAAAELGGRGAARPIHVEHAFDRALRLARDLAGGGTVLVAGSCHTVGDALRRESDARSGCCFEP